VNGTVDLEYAPSGVTWRLMCPAANVLEPRWTWARLALSRRSICRCGPWRCGGEIHDEASPLLVAPSALASLGVLQAEAGPHRTHGGPSLPNRPWRAHLPDGARGFAGAALRCRKPGSLRSLVRGVYWHFW